MWLKKLVAISMIVTLIGMNGIAIAGLLAPNSAAGDIALTATLPTTLPVVNFSADPTEVQTGLFSALTWSVEGEVESCTASGDWSGEKTAIGSQSTGRLATQGSKTYTLRCKNSAGTIEKSVNIVVKDGTPSAMPSSTSTNSNGATAQQAPQYCSGATPCYGPHDVAAHNTAGNCWGYNGNRVINVGGFDAAYHQARSGISSIEVSGICGTNLAGSLAGSVSAGGQTRNHNNATKANADRNMVPYFVGYFDASKP